MQGFRKVVVVRPAVMDECEKEAQLKRGQDKQEGERQW